jgi:transcriptional repressor NrdR
MEGLRTLDAVAYVRYASVYRDFRDAHDFSELIGRLAAEEQAQGPLGDGRPEEPGGA